MSPRETLERSSIYVGAILSLLAPASAAAQAQRDTTSGFVIRDSLIVASCAKCHVRDSTGRLGRISYMRKSPEGWEASIRRMVTLNDVTLEPATARAIVRYLSDNQGLAPEEARPGRFEAERRQIDHRYTADTRTAATCTACHSMGRVITQRRTRSEWELLIATHRGLYPVVDGQTFRRNAPSSPDSAPAQHPMDVAIAHLARALPLRTPEWAAWSATMRPPRLEGTWILSGTEPGRGAFVGRLSIARGAGESEFTTRATYRYLNGGPAVTRTGRSVVYTGFQWRGRSTDAARGPTDEGLREVFFIEPGWQEMSGRWFTGGYDEIGMDVSLTRLGASTVVTAVAPRALRAGTTNQELTILGANFPRALDASAIEFGPGVKVDRIVRVTPDSVTLRVSVDSGAAIGARDLFAAGAGLRAAAVVTGEVNRIKVTPLAGFSRVGGAVFPKQLQQFDAIAYHNGPDGRPDTPDDIEIGPVQVTWSLEEYAVTYDDDDLKFVGAIDQRGLFTPALDGPNPQRSGSRNNIGDVWAVATYQPPGRGARPIKARAHLVVSVPLYMRWEPWRIAP